MSGIFVGAANSNATSKLLPATPPIDRDTPITDRNEPVSVWAAQVGECMRGQPRLEVTTYNGGTAKTYTLNPDGIIAANTKGNAVCTK